MQKSKIFLSLLALICTAVCVKTGAQDAMQSTRLWYDKPAKSWQHEALPIGNGRLGAMIFGKVSRERIAMNEETVWSGMRYDWNREGASKNLPKIRELLLAGKNAEAEALVNQTFTCTSGGSKGGANGPWGCFQELGNLNITWHSEVESLPLNTWKYEMLTTPGIKDYRKQHRDIQRQVAEKSKVEADDSSWTDYEIRDGKVIKGARLLKRDEKAILRDQFTLTETQHRQLGVLRLDTGVRNGEVYVNEEKVGSLPGYRSGGHARFEKDVSQYLKPGKNVIAIYCRWYRRVGQLPVSVSLEPKANVTDYRRSLDLNNAIAKVSYKQDGVTYTREAFSSAPDQVMVFHFRADKPGMISFDSKLSRLRSATTQADGQNGLLMTGNTNAQRGKPGMKFVARLHALNKGGTLSTNTDTLTIKGADEVILLIAAGTDYQGFAGRKTPDPLEATKLDIEKASKKSYQNLRSDHVKDYRSYFDRMSIHLDDGNPGSLKRAELPTDQRLSDLAKGEADPAMFALYFNFGRYLLISSSRPGCMPANLQGLWAEGIKTPWNCDYHLDINVQMNYWPAEVTGLGDCHKPLFKLIESLQKPGAETAKAYYNANGWVAHVITNVWGFTAPGEQAGWGATATGSPWLCDHLWEHYAYTNDKEFLKWAYPIMKGSAEFFLDMLITEPKTGWLVTAPSNSPENTLIMPNGKTARVCMGPTMDMQILRELFDNCIAAATILDIDKDFRTKLGKARSKLAPTRIGKHGQIMEWLEDYDEKEPTHRHVSHLYGLHPYDEITPENTPKLAEAARVTLQRRGDKSTGWSMAWKANFWARLHDGNHAYKLLSLLITRGGRNLLCQHAPFQIDGNFGGTAAIAEMLLQCTRGTIRLLPALPDAWPNGNVTGLRARGGYKIDMEWKDGQLINAVIHNLSAEGACKIRYGDKIISLTIPKGKHKPLTPAMFEK